MSLDAGDLAEQIPQNELLWALGSICALHRLPFDAGLAAREFPPPTTHATLVAAARALKLRIKEVRPRLDRIGSLVFPLLIALRRRDDDAAGPSLGIITAAKDDKVVLFRAGSNTPQALSLDELADEFIGSKGMGKAWLAAPEPEAVSDPDAAGVSRSFGFRWFVPELLKHRKVWRDVLLASLALQLIALATPLFTQAIIDKVVVHRTQSTLMAIGVAMLLFTAFSGVLGWVRQYLVLHTGNRVDAVLGSAVWDHLLKLPLRYFEHRSTGVVSARLQGIETIREFVSGAAISLVLDLPFLLICLGVMLWYSVPLTAVALAILTVIAVVSVIIAPQFQAQLNEQFMMGARNQAFVTEHIAGFETVKSLQMEPQLRRRYNGYLASLLAASFKTKQLGNTYNTFATTMDQLQTLAILLVGAWTVMNEPSFTVGMLVAFQMFSSKLSQPVLRIVGLWSQFQQASLAVKRLGDLMNAAAEPYSLKPMRQGEGGGHIRIEGLAFRYAPSRPMVYQDVSLDIGPGQLVGITGPSGSGKSTLAKLLLGFYAPTAGSISIDGVDIRHMSANELRSHIGVVPQETILFSGSILDNVKAGNPAATVEQVTMACRLADIHSTIEQLPQGYQTAVGERGVGLSGGQKQRLAIARALLKSPKVLVFDEATSALDRDTAEAIAKTVNSLKRKVTMLFITHAEPGSLVFDSVVRLPGQSHIQAPISNIQRTGS